MSIQVANILFVYHVFGKKVGTEDRSLTTLQLWAAVAVIFKINLVTNRMKRKSLVAEDWSGAKSSALKKDGVFQVFSKLLRVHSYRSISQSHHRAQEETNTPHQSFPTDCSISTSTQANKALWNHEDFFPLPDIQIRLAHKALWPALSQKSPAGGTTDSCRL